MVYILETGRLRLREFDLQDAGFIVSLLNTRGWLDFIGDKNVHNVDEAIAYLRSGPIRSYRENGFGVYLAELKEDAIPVGMCGILKRDALLYPDIGFAFLPDYGGKGYALESARAILNYARDHLQIATVYAITKADNTKSIRLLEAIGLKFIRTITFTDVEEDLLLYSSNHRAL